MASPQNVRAYLAYWFQLGKPMMIPGLPEPWLPSPVFANGRYSDDFEACWQHIMAQGGEGCYLVGTDQTINDLLSPKWDICGCPRCPMPVPMLVAGVPTSPCPCHDLPSWPNSEVPEPRLGVQDQHHLSSLRDRLQSLGDRDLAQWQKLQATYHHSPNLYPQPAPVPHDATKEAAS